MPTQANNNGFTISRLLLATANIEQPNYVTVIVNTSDRKPKHTKTITHHPIMQDNLQTAMHSRKTKNHFVFLNNMLMN